jgi:hypothetical protein
MRVANDAVWTLRVSLIESFPSADSEWTVSVRNRMELTLDYELFVTCSDEATGDTNPGVAR